MAIPPPSNVGEHTADLNSPITLLSKNKLRDQSFEFLYL